MKQLWFWIICGLFLQFLLRFTKKMPDLAFRYGHFLCPMNYHSWELQPPCASLRTGMSLASFLARNSQVDNVGQFNFYSKPWIDYFKLYIPAKPGFAGWNFRDIQLQLDTGPSGRPLFTLFPFLHLLFQPLQGPQDFHAFLIQFMQFFLRRPELDLAVLFFRWRQNQDRP